MNCKFARLFLLFPLLAVCCALSIGIAAQNKVSKDSLFKFSRSKYQLAGQDAVYEGFKGAFYLDQPDYAEYYRSMKQFKFGDIIFHQAYFRSDHDGLAAENPVTKETRVYPLFRLAEAVGWYRQDARNNGYPDATRGLFAVGDKLWMGSNGVGILVYDTTKQTWARYDDKNFGIAGAHAELLWADENYAFVTGGEFPAAGLLAYSARQNSWIVLKQIPTKWFSDFGYTDWDMPVQLPVDDRQLNNSTAVILDWHLAMVSQVTPAADGKSYIFERQYHKSKTVYALPIEQLELAFDSQKKK